MRSPSSDSSSSDEPDSEPEPPPSDASSAGTGLPSRLARALCFFNLCFWVVTFCTVDSFPSLAMSVGESNVFFIYAAFSALSCLFVHSCCIETRGCTLDEIEKRFAALDDPKRAVEEEGARRPLLDA